MLHCIAFARHVKGGVGGRCAPPIDIGHGVIVRHHVPDIYVLGHCLQVHFVRVRVAGLRCDGDDGVVSEAAAQVLRELEQILRVLWTLAPRVNNRAKL